MPGIAEDVAEVAKTMTTTLPPVFIGLLVINLFFILGLLWFMHDVAITRIEAVTKIVQACVQQPWAERR